ncbi:MAG: hypothetical protein ABRQ38_23655, partial [Candidatus Eremiobacterota bacterium]
AFFHSDDFEYLDRRFDTDKIFLANKEGVRYEGGRYRPLTILTVLMDRAIWGLNPTGYNLTNKIFHVICTGEVYYLTNMLFPGNNMRGFLSALFFSVHPIFTDTIFWISARPDSLCCIFYILSIIFFYKGTLTLSYISFIPALMAKEMAVTLPAIIFITSLILQPENKEKGYTCHASRITCHVLRKSLPYFIILSLYMIFRLIFLGSMTGGTGNTNFTFFRVLKHLKEAFYFMTFPASRYDLVIFLFLAIFLSVKSLRKYIFQKDILYCLLWILITLVPVLGLMARWYMYIPFIGLSMALSVILLRLENFYIKIFFAVITIIIIVTNIHLVRREATLWYQSGNLVKTIEEDIYSYKDREYYIVNVPAAVMDNSFFGLGEKPVFAYNLEKAVNIIHRSHVRVYPVTTVFLMDFSVTSAGDVKKIDDKTFLIELNEEKSRFSYHTEDFLSGKIKPAPGVTIEHGEFTIISGEKNNKITVKFKKPVKNLFEFNRGHISHKRWIYSLQY